MTLEEFLNKKPNKAEVADQLCKIANHVLFNPPWECVFWEELANYGGLTKDDFWEDFDDLTPVDYMNGQTAWKYKNGKDVETDVNKQNELSKAAKELYEQGNKKLD